MTRQRFTFSARKVELHVGDSIDVLLSLPAESVDFVAADPPYFLSGKGTTCKSGKRVAVSKGAWDRPTSADQQVAFATLWLHACIRLLRPHGSIMVNGTSHGIRHVHRAAVDGLGMTLINNIVWGKPNPPPNLGCRSLQHANETILWLAPTGKRWRYWFNYQACKALAGKQMRDVWPDILPPSRAEKARGGGHRTQKPIALLERELLVACPPGGDVLDPFLGSGTTIEAALRFGCRSATGIDLDPHNVETARARARWWSGVMGSGPTPRPRSLGT